MEPSASRLAWSDDLDDALKNAARKGAEGKVLIYFFSDGAFYCRLMDEETFSDPAVAEYLGDFERVRVDCSTPSGDKAALRRKYEVRGYPTFVILDAKGALLAKVEGYYPPARFIARLTEAMEKAREPRKSEKGNHGVGAAPAPGGRKPCAPGGCSGCSGCGR